VRKLLPILLVAALMATAHAAAASTDAGRPAASIAKKRQCDKNYSGRCLRPNVYDYDCAGGSGNGPRYVSGPFYVVGYDRYGLDSDGDGIACES
jgi:hypothetical protein